MVSEGRQRIIEANRSLRLIKNELESLLEKGMLDDDAFDSISKLLPTESSISNSATPAQRQAGLPTPAPSSVASPAPTSPPTAAMNNMSLNAASGPPSYSQSTGGGPPALPGRSNPPPPAGKPVIAHARALYRYAATDARDCSFERDDRIAVHEYMNADWWMGRNERTGQEGIFPKNYVQVEANQPPPPPAPANNWAPVDEKAGMYQAPGYPPPAQQQYGGYPPPPAQGNPYNANVPPMAVADQSGGQQQQQQGGENKIAEGGKKFGKKLGNAAIFGAGATIGSNIVNSIF
ncbi:SH3-domain-containing protein [Thozetella sp. PMI_491]|nr:SH3-domain-containing protein [Thozetella sp. PMI_491]